MIQTKETNSPRPCVRDTRMRANEFLSLVDEMRNAQREYFRERSYSSLTKAKALEKRVDECISIIRHDIMNGKTTQLLFEF